MKPELEHCPTSQEAAARKMVEFVEEPAGNLTWPESYTVARHEMQALAHYARLGLAAADRIKALEEALTKIAAGTGVYGMQAGEYKQITRAALEGLAVVPSGSDYARGYAAAREHAAKVARDGCLVPPDGGSPTSAEVELCEAIAARIRAMEPKP